MKKKFEFGKIDYYGTGRRINAVDVEIELRETAKGPEFTACGDVWNVRHSDVVSGGQNLDEIARFKAQDPVFSEIYALWKKHHLNSMHAGDEAQEACLDEFFGESRYDYDLAVDALKKAGLYEHNGYRYGSDWLYRPIPEDDMKKIQALLA